MNTIRKYYFSLILFVLFIPIFASIADMKKDEKYVFSKEVTTNLKNNLHNILYIKDTRTNICYAVVVYYDGLSMTSVSCTKEVENLIK